MNLGDNQKVALMTRRYGRGRVFRAAAIAVFIALPTLPLPEGHMLIPYLQWVSGLGAIAMGLITTTTEVAS
jgi:hypothetical protein